MTKKCFEQFHQGYVWFFIFPIVFAVTRQVENQEHTDLLLEIQKCVPCTIQTNTARTWTVVKMWRSTYDKIV